ncbi:ankyrin repeat domain-containing protein [Roseibium sp.]|uniref:ankyrin repeat domain-containing protein n=1 Tax=Roseibium sp. TaxID=1936156 RepID=UPI003D0D3CE4
MSRPAFLVVCALAVFPLECRSGELHSAAAQGDRAAVETLLANVADINASDFRLGTALHYAAVSDQAEIADILVRHGADMEIPGELQETRPLHLAAEMGSEQTAQVLLRHGADIEALDGNGRSVLARAAIAGQVGILRLLLEQGARIEARLPLSGRTALIEAAYTGQLEAAKFLVEMGAEVNARDNRGKSALWYASTPESYSPAGGPGLLRLLVENGADLEAGDDTGTTPLAWARKSYGRSRTYRDIADELVRLGAQE